MDRDKLNEMSAWLLANGEVAAKAAALECSETEPLVGDDVAMVMLFKDQGKVGRQGGGNSHPDAPGQVGWRRG